MLASLRAPAIEKITSGVMLVNGDTLVFIGFTDKAPIEVMRTGTNSFLDLFTGGTITVRPDGELEGKYTLYDGRKAVWTTADWPVAQ
jgi:hypothetical protein